MKKYVFITCGVLGIGGGQLYVSNKCEYLSNRGYSVVSISTSPTCANKKLIYKGLYKGENWFIPELNNPPETYSRLRRERITKKIVSMLNVTNDDEIIIESNSLMCAVWAERIAEIIGARHIVFSVSEHNQVNEYFKEFLEFKFDRCELSTIKSSTFKELFEASTIVTADNIRVMNAVLGDNVEEYECEALNKVELGDHNICVMGRGEKRYISFACNALADFCEIHETDTFTVGLVSEFGDKEAERQAIGRLLRLKNVRVYLLGYFSPLPKKLFRMFDLYIGGAGCASLSYRQKALTLAMNVHRDAPLGLMGYDVTQTLIDPEGGIEMADVLEDAMYLKGYLKKEYCPPRIINSDEAFAPHMQWLNETSKQKEYFTKQNKYISFKEMIGAKFPYLISVYGYIWRRINGK